MNILPKVLECPCCSSVNLVRINEVSYDNNFKSLSEWILKKFFNCRKCKTKLCFFVNKENKIEKTIWFDLFQCEDMHFDRLKRLQSSKDSFKKQNKNYFKVLKEIRDIQNKINLDKIKVKVKAKIEGKEILVRHVH
jgi:hypothetical protein